MAATKKKTPIRIHRKGFQKRAGSTSSSNTVGSFEKLYGVELNASPEMSFREFLKREGYPELSEVLEMAEKKTRK